MTDEEMATAFAEMANDEEYAALTRRRDAEFAYASYDALMLNEHIRAEMGRPKS